MKNGNILDDVMNHKNLKGSVFKRKLMDPKRVKSLGFFGLSFGLWSYFPYLALTFGSNLTTFAVTSTAICGMFKFHE